MAGILIMHVSHRKFIVVNSVPVVDDNFQGQIGRHIAVILQIHWRPNRHAVSATQLHRQFSIMVDTW